MRPRIIIALLIILFFSSCAGVATGRKAAYATSVTQIEAPVSSVHFATGKDKVLSQDRISLMQNAKWLQENPEIVIVLAGHCDERGSDGSNMALGDRRARSVKADFIREGVQESQLATIISYGERQPVDTAHNETAWRKNRRVEFIVR